MWLSHPLTFVLRVLVGAQPRWIGCQPSNSLRIYYANHTSHMDTLALWCALPAPLRTTTRPVAAADYWGGGGIKSYLATRGFNALFIERDAGKAEISRQQYQTTYDKQVKALGEDDADTLDSLHGVASAYSDLARYDEARRIYNPLIEKYKAKFGKPPI